MSERRLYWLKLKESFFTDKAMKKLRRMAGGLRLADDRPQRGENAGALRSGRRRNKAGRLGAGLAGRIQSNDKRTGTGGTV